MLKDVSHLLFIEFLVSPPGCVEGPVLPGTSVANSSIFSYEVPCGSRSQSGVGGTVHSEASAWIRPELSEGAISYQPSSAEIAVDYFLKKLANKEISQR